jgi:ABC-type nitrate/sulfonate/bicarbonate transport system substrate-binding protein
VTGFIPEGLCLPLDMKEESTMRYKLLLLVLISGLLAVMAVGCGAEEAAAPEPPAQQVAEPAEEAPPAAPARTTHLRFTLDWAVQGPQAPFLVALDKGYFAEEGLSVVIDRGFGSADAVSKIAGGAYNLGYADINSMIEFNASNPGRCAHCHRHDSGLPPFLYFDFTRS